VTRHGALESAGGRRIPQPSEAVTDEHSCTSAASPVATGPALTHAGWWSHIFAAALDLSLERRFEPATRPHTAVSADVNVELNACEFAAVGTRTRFVTHHARIDAVLAPPRSNTTFLCASATISPGREVNCVRVVARVGATLTTTEQRSKGVLGNVTKKPWDEKPLPAHLSDRIATQRSDSVMIPSATRFQRIHGKNDQLLQ
jgi:hypothetical protein